jgi:hypothetical protein
LEKVGTMTDDLRLDHEILHGVEALVRLRDSEDYAARCVAFCERYRDRLRALGFVTEEEHQRIEAEASSR